ncbi:MAG: aminotransferase class IV [Planctomycetota bacterium]
MPLVLQSEQRLYGASHDGAALLSFHPAFGSASRAIDHVAPGVYEGLRTFGRSRFFGLRSHLDRLRDSIAGFRVPLEFDEETLVAALAAAAADATEAFDAEARVRVDVAAEPADALGSPSNLLLAVTPFRGLPEAIVREGATMRSVPGLRRPDPAVKTSDFILLREAWIAAHGDADAYEHLMLSDDGSVLEGTQSNLVLVRDGALYTAPSGVLPGVTLRAALDVARADGIDVRLEFTPFAEIDSFDEAFMTTSVRSIVPVSRIDDVSFQHVGPVTERVGALYDALADREAVEPSLRARAAY